jgi:hypothetical protein
LDKGKVVSGKPVVARRHTTTLFDPVEEPFDLVAFGSMGLMAIHS